MDIDLTRSADAIITSMLKTYFIDFKIISELNVL